MFFLYNFFQLILTLLFLPFILLLFIIKPKFRSGLFEKLGFYKFNLENKPTILFHAVSVGEVNAIEKLVKETSKKLPSYNIIVSTVTLTGHKLACEKFFSYANQIIFFPYDFYLSVFSLLKKLNPQKIIIAETEIWPNFVNIANKLNIEVIIVNGRISQKSYRGYKKISFFLKNILKKYSYVLMQTDDDKQRILSLGSDDSKTYVMGNLKFDIEKYITYDEVNNLKNEFKIYNNNLIIASSTHYNEEEIVVNLYKKLKENTDLKLLVAPRHPDRFKQVENLILKSGYKLGKRSKLDNFENCDIIILDTIGELSKIYSICKFAFIGGSFSNKGGHNPLEATIWDKPTICGPSFFNFKDIYTILTNKNASFIVNSEDELFNISYQLLNNDIFYKKAVKNCNQVFVENKGALSKAINVILQ